MKEQSPTPPAWIEEVRARGLQQAARTLLDILEPLGPLGAQVLWVAQPVFGLFGYRQHIGELAQALDEPGGVERLRNALENPAISRDISETNKQEPQQ